MSGLAHCLHFIMCLITGFVWLPVWILCALCCSSSNKKYERKMQKEQLMLLRKIAKERQ